jgi:hypothetical protein
VIITTSYKFILLYENVDMCQAVSPTDNYKNACEVLCCKILFAIMADSRSAICDRIEYDFKESILEFL